MFRTYADSAATRTIGADRSAWRKWKAFCARHHIERLWRNDVASNSGADARGHRREVYILRAFLIETHRMMAPRRRRKKRAKPRSALNVVAGVRRIHKRAMIDMVSCGHLAMALRGLNSQFLREEGSNKALLEERAEPLNNVECASMINIANGTPLRGWTVDWLSVEGVSFKAGLLTGRQSGMRKADLASLDDEREPHEMAKDNLTWYLSDGAGGYRHVPELPPAHVLVDGECACLRPAASKADQTAEQFGNQLIYLPVIRSDVNNAALALAKLERVHVVHGDDRQHAPLLVANESGLALTCGRIDRIFTALARAALGDALASKRSFHSCRVFAACCHKAHGEDDSVPDSTLAKDTFAWKEWMRHCDKLNTIAWRPDRNGLDLDERARERFLFDSFLIEDYKRMVRAKPTAKPRSAVGNLMAVRRVLRRGGVTPADSPNTNTILRGLLNRYVSLHGAEVLAPRRAEPLVNSDMTGILGVPDATRARGITVNWASPRFRSFRAYLCTTWMAAFRKADVLCQRSGDFDMRDASRGHLAWRYRGELKRHLTQAELRSLSAGDCAVLTPVPVKNDPFAEFFGNHPIWLPYDANDPFNAAKWLADLELAFPVPVERRRFSPLFPADGASSPLTHGMADAIFSVLSTAGLGEARAAQLSLHSPRVFAASALLARGCPRPMILALCRWKDERSLDIYTRAQTPPTTSGGFIECRLRR